MNEDEIVQDLKDKRDETQAKEDAFKVWFRHAIDIESYGNSFSNDILEMYFLLKDDIETELKKVKTISSKRKLEELLNEVNELIDTFVTELNDFISETINKVTEQESSWLQKYGKIIGISYLVSRGVKSQVSMTPFADSKEYKTLSNNVSNKVKDTVSSVLKSSYFTKESSEDFSQTVTSKLSKLEKGIATESKTMSTAMFRATDSSVFRFNKQQVIYSAMLDMRTCLVCGDYHGKVFMADQAPLLPIHERCRCTLIPLAAYDPEQSPETYSQFLSELEDDELYDVLGKARYDMYKSGVPITSFVSDGSILTLEELADKGLYNPDE